MSMAPTDLRVDDGWYMMDLGPVNVVYMDDRVTDASYNRYTDHLRDHLAGLAGTGRRRGVLYDVPDMRALSGERRAELAEVLNEFRSTLASVNAAYVLATPSRVVRSVVQMVFWLAPPPYPYEVVSAVGEGVSFLAAHTPGMDAAGWARDYGLARGDLLGRLHRAAM